MNPGMGEEQVFSLAVGRSTIGRTRDNAIVCVHKSLSRVHAALEFDGKHVRVIDLDSKNGVFVRGKRVRTLEIEDGDTFRCGDVNFMLEAGAHDAPPAAEPKLSAAVAQTLPSPLALGQALSQRPQRTAPKPAVPVVTDDDGRYRERLFVLVRATELLSSQLGLEHLLDELSALGAQVLDVDRLALLTLDEESLDMSPRVLKAFVGSLGAPYSQRVIDWVLDHGSPGSFADVSKDLTLPGDARADRHIRAALAVPIDPGAGAVGVLYVDSLSRTEAFHPDDVALLRAIANVAAVGIELASLRTDGRR
jgi:adenylate cyclase